MHLFQVGAGSGGIAVLDLLARDPRLTRVTLVEPDVYAAHNVYRHLFPPSAVGRPKVELASEWLHALRPELTVDALPFDLTDPVWQPKFARFVAACDVGVCAADNELAKFAFDGLMRAAGKPWTLGEVLSGGIGGWVHRFAPGGACYGCVASHLQREVKELPDGPPPDYSVPGGPRPETSIPASKASIAVIAGLHALVTLGEPTPSPADAPPPPKGRGESEPAEPNPGFGSRGGPTPPAPLPIGRGETEPAEPERVSGARTASPSTSPLPAGRGVGGVGPPRASEPPHEPPQPHPPAASLLFSLRAVPGVFDAPFRAYPMAIPRNPMCLTCGTAAPLPTGDQLDAAVADALARLGAG